ncbi:MAG TPA: AbrB/MazE/SpoVT family DNA-binding domain-containing protein [Candidatus Angelobacter sp.]|jgi:putative addiction module antidote
MAVLKLTSFGDSTVVVIPPEMLKRLKVSEGDELVAIEVPGGYLLTTHDLERQRQLKVALEVMDEYQETLRMLANRE